MDEQQDLNWMDNVKAPIELSEMKGVVIAIHEPREVQTKDWGKRRLIDFIIEGKEGKIVASEFLPSQFPFLTPNSGLGRLLKKYDCEALKEIIGKEVELVKGKQDMIKIKKE